MRLGHGGMNMWRSRLGTARGGQHEAGAAGRQLWTARPPCSNPPRATTPRHNSTPQRGFQGCTQPELTWVHMNSHAATLAPGGGAVRVNKHVLYYKHAYGAKARVIGAHKCHL